MNIMKRGLVLAFVTIAGTTLAADRPIEVTDPLSLQFHLSAPQFTASKEITSGKNAPYPRADPRKSRTMFPQSFSFINNFSSGVAGLILSAMPISGNSPAPSLTFNPKIGSFLPDLEGAIGIDEIISVANFQPIVIHDKNGNLLNQFSFENLCTGDLGYFDPRVSYHESSNRYIAAANFLGASGPPGVCIAISRPGNPNKWESYKFYDRPGGFTDFVRLGLSDNLLTAHYIYFPTDGSNYSKSVLLAASLEPANPNDRRALTFYQLDDFVNSFVPFSQSDPTPGAPSVRALFLAGGEQFVRLARIIAQPNNVPRFEIGDIFSSADAQLCPEAQQLNGPGLVNYAPSPQPQERGGQWFTNNVNCAGSAPSFEIQRYSSATNLQIDRMHAVGSLDAHINFSSAINDFGDTLTGFTESSMSTYPSAGYIFRMAGDQQGTRRASYRYLVAQAAHPHTRVGDYSSTDVDPADGCSFWTLQLRGEASTDLTDSTAWAKIPCQRIPSQVTSLESFGQAFACGDLTVLDCIGVRWSRVKIATYYELQTASNTQFSAQVVTQQISSTTANGRPGHFARVRACNSTGCGTWSSIIQLSFPLSG